MDFLILINEFIHEDRTLQKTLASVSNSGRNPEKEMKCGICALFQREMAGKKQKIEMI